MTPWHTREEFLALLPFICVKGQLLVQAVSLVLQHVLDSNLIFRVNEHSSVLGYLQHTIITLLPVPFVKYFC